MKSKFTDVTAPHGREQTIKMDILGMIHSCENPFDIIYRIAQYLEEESSEGGYAQIVLENMRTIYGVLLKDKKLLTDELNDVTERLHRIEKALESEEFLPEEKARITLAVELHRKNIARLEAKINWQKVTNGSMYIEKY